MLAEANEEICACIWVENGLEGDFALVHLERWSGPAGAIAGGAQKVADYGNVGVQNLGRSSSGATQCYRWLLGGSLFYWCGWNGGLGLCNRGGWGSGSRRRECGR